ncbi:MAG: DUF3302 domain-containing protein [Halioglobus sp.]
MALEIFALVVMFVVAAVGIWLVVVVGSFPGKVARERQHPQADAINALAWVGLITLGLAWFVAIVWAYAKPIGSIQQMNDLQQRVEALEKAGDKSGQEPTQ